MKQIDRPHFQQAEPTIWMNVTTSDKWRRAAVGVVRVEQEVRKQLGERLGARLQTVVFQNGKFGPSGRSSKTSFEGTDFWPDPSFGTSADPFDVLQSQSLQRQRFTSSAKTDRFTFRPGDVLISIGLDWDYGDLQAEIRRLVKVYDLTVITCCYDLIPVLFPQYCVGDVASWFKDYLIDMTWNSDGVLCISENTRTDYLQLCSSIGLPERRTEVIRLGSSLPTNISPEEPSKNVGEILSDKFFLFVSTIERRKNHEVLYRAYRLLRTEHPDLELPKLVFVGMQGWGVGDLISDIRLDPLTQKDIVLLDHVTDAELTLLYSECEAFLYPSLYEGWGLPVAEALQLGRPVIASDAGSIPEVGGDLVRYLDPWAPREWANELLGIATGKVDVRLWSERIRNEFVSFEWAAAAETIITLAQELGRSKGRARRFQAGYDMSTLHGVRYGDKIVYSGRQGIVCHGPYIAIGPGSYQIKMTMELVRSVEGVLRLQAVHETGETSFATLDLETQSLTPGRHEIVLRVDLSQQVDDFEVVCEVDCVDDIRVAIETFEIGLAAEGE